jgi:hypothetical protein
MIGIISGFSSAGVMCFIISLLWWTQVRNVIEGARCQEKAKEDLPQRHRGHREKNRKTQREGAKRQRNKKNVTRRSRETEIQRKGALSARYG